MFREEMDAWQAKKLNKPFVFTEFGTDTLDTLHKLPGVMWSQEYQQEYMSMHFEVFAGYPAIQGELAWNFADFQTGQGIMRVNGNKKGVFTRQRQPKAAAYTIRERWLNIK
jgi:beta-glucuronidase